MKSVDRPAAPQRLRCARFELVLARPLIMGIVNITPDSFSDGGRYLSAQAAIGHAWRLIEEGADIVDLGAESTRPGALPIPIDAELQRLVPVLRALRDSPVPISIDTTKPEVMVQVIDAGASMINDITALTTSGALEAVARSSVAVCLMHMQGEPRSMQVAPSYGSVVADVRDWLQARITAALAAGITRERIVIDPGFGFGKTARHNLELLHDLLSLTALGCPLLAGLSRKSLLGAITGRVPDQRSYASVAAALLAVERGAQLVRVHDVAATRDALRVLWAVDNLELEKQ